MYCYNNPGSQTDVITPLLKKLRHTYRSPATSSQLNVEDELNTTALDKKNKV